MPSPLMVFPGYAPVATARSMEVQNDVMSETTETTEDSELIADSPQPTSRRVLLGVVVLTIGGAAAVLGRSFLFGTVDTSTSKAASNLRSRQGPTFAEFFESDEMAKAMTKELHDTASAHMANLKIDKAPWEKEFKHGFHNAVDNYRRRGPAAARQLAAPLEDAHKSFLVSLLTKIHTPQARDIGARVHEVMRQRDGKSPEELHQIILDKHGSLIAQYASEMFPDFLTGATDGRRLVKEEAGARDATDARQLQPSRVGTHKAAVGLGIGGLTAQVISIILQGVQMCANPKFHPKIPRWVVGTFDAIADALGTSACVLDLTGVHETMANMSTAPKLKKFGLNLDVHIGMPGWLKCAIFEGITGLVSIISLITEFLPANIGMTASLPFNMERNHMKGLQRLAVHQG